MKNDRAYLDRIAGQLRGEGFSVETMLALGDPPSEIIKVAEDERCDLIAMAGHGHRFFGDLFHGSTITQIRHHTNIPLLVLRAKKI
jgi:manganese transport protein